MKIIKICFIIIILIIVFYNIAFSHQPQVTIWGYIYDSRQIAGVVPKDIEIKIHLNEQIHTTSIRDSSGLYWFTFDLPKDTLFLSSLCDYDDAYAAKDTIYQFPNALIRLDLSITPTTVVEYPDEEEEELTDEGEILPAVAELYQNYPNPFNPETTITYQLNSPLYLKLSIYSASGQLIRILDEGHKTAGYHTIIWDGRSSDGQLVSTGLYLYNLET